MKLHWHDAIRIDGWSDISDLPDDPILLVAQGTKVKETDSIVWLALQVDEEDGTAQGCIGIPTAMILRREEWGAE